MHLSLFTLWQYSARITWIISSTLLPFLIYTNISFVDIYSCQDYLSTYTSSLMWWLIININQHLRWMINNIVMVIVISEGRIIHPNLEFLSIFGSKRSIIYDVMLQVLHHYLYLGNKSCDLNWQAQQCFLQRGAISSNVKNCSVVEIRSVPISTQRKKVYNQGQISDQYQARSMNTNSSTSGFPTAIANTSTEWNCEFTEFEKCVSNSLKVSSTIWIWCEVNVCVWERLLSLCLVALSFQTGQSIPVTEMPRRCYENRTRKQSCNLLWLCYQTIYYSSFRCTVLWVPCVLTRHVFFISLQNTLNQVKLTFVSLALICNCVTLVTLVLLRMYRNFSEVKL